jgi:exopolysaccharide production protein ExoQ
LLTSLSRLIQLHKMMRQVAAKESGNSSLAWWLSLILIIRITSFFMLSDSAAVTQVIKVVLRLFVTGISFIILARQLTRNKNFSFGSNYPMTILLYLGYLGLGGLSLLWTSSLNDSLLQLLMDIENLVFCAIFISVILIFNEGHEKKIRLSRMLSSAIFIIMLGFLLGRYLIPDAFYRLTHGGEVARLGGFIINPNELGMLIATGIAMCCSELNFRKNKVWLVMMMAVLVYTLILTGSRSSMIGLFLIILFYLKKSGSATLQVTVLAGMIISVPFIISEIFIKAGDISEVMSMTGRIPFWHDLLSINFPKAPILGFGFMRIDQQDRFESLTSYAGEMTHNTFIQVLMNLGLVGLFIVILQVAFTIHAMASGTDSNKRMLAMGLFIPAIINSFTEFGIFGETNFGIMFYLFIVFTYGLKVNKAAEIPYAGKIHGAPEKNTVFRPSFTA